MRGRPYLGALGARRWPLEPLLQLTAKTPSGFARAYGLRAGSVCAAVHRGLNDRQADEWALAADLHPAVVWGPEWDEAAAVLDDDQEAA